MYGGGSCCFASFRRLRDPTEQRTQRQATTQAVVTDFGVGLRSLSENADLACVWVRGLEDYSSLTESERIRFSNLRDFSYARQGYWEVQKIK